MQRYRFLVFGPSVNVLFLGLPLLASCTPEQLRVVLAHEFGHQRGGHGKLNAWMYRLYLTWWALSRSEQAQQAKRRSWLRWFVNWYAQYLDVTTLAMRRRHEYDADRLSAEVCGATTTGQMLIAFNWYSYRLEREFQPALRRLAASESLPPADLLQRLGSTLASPPQPATLHTWRRRDSVRRTVVSEEHPCRLDRLTALGCEGLLHGTEPWIPGAIVPTDAALALLGESLDRQLQIANATWKATIIDYWRYEHKKATAILKAAGEGDVAGDAETAWKGAQAQIESNHTMCRWDCTKFLRHGIITQRGGELAMTIHVYNTLTHQKDPLIPREAGKVSMYVCGPTPYDYPHLGNARPTVVFDIIRRYLEYSGFQVTYVTNFTDVEDKIIKRSNEQGIPWDMLAQRFIDIYFEEMDSLNVKRATVYPRASENIEEIINLTQALIDRGYAYVMDGDVYFEVRKFPEYGQLSNRNIDELESGARVEISEIKRDPLDFALWKAAKPGEPSWPSPWGPGRPGWHIECSAMSIKLLGQGFDIHGGGQDLIFPHHENELAQSEGAMGHKTFARYWLHNGMITINKEKMSKSLGNFFTVREILERYPADVVRYFLTASQYRSPIDFSDQTLDQAVSAFERLKLGVFNMARVIAADKESTETRAEQSDGLRALLETAEADFRIAMDDDFNTPKAVAVLFDLVGEANRLTGDPSFVPDAVALTAISDARVLVLRLADILGLQLLTEEKGQDTLAPQLMELLIDLRRQARQDKNFALADAIRNRLTEIGVILEDTAQGTVWRRK